MAHVALTTRLVVDVNQFPNHPARRPETVPGPETPLRTVGGLGHTGAGDLPPT
jgi:hypothetical protein